ncbi:MAG: MFS transporter [Thermodesulfovibrionia bacterium]|nr:MFS transporter [Thermodesulfovibrionia bacterium]
MKTNGSDRIKKSLHYSIIDGTFAASMIGFGESFLAAFAVFLKATNINLGLLSSMPLLIGSLSQLYSNRLIRLFGSRKNLVSTAALLQGLMYIPISLVFFFGTFRIAHLIFFACLYWLFGMILSPAWNSWMGDLVNENERGAYFGMRNKVTGFATFSAYMAGGYILQNFSSTPEMQYIGFVTIFSLALISRIASFFFLRKKYEPPYEVSESAEFSFVEFIRQARFRNYGTFVLYLSLMNSCVYMSAPFFTPYMLNDLKFSYSTYTIIIAAAIISKLLFMPVWGKASDRFGSRKVLSLSGFLMPLAPILWLFSSSVWYLLAVQIYAGFVWAGFEIASFNFIFDTTTPQKRATGIAYYNVINGVAIFAGSLIGGLIVRYNQIFWSNYLLVFVVSCIIRYIASFIFIPKLREVREVEHIPYSKLFLKVISTTPTIGLVYDLIPFKKKSD